MRLLISNGFLFIGDPHVWSKRPGRRRDNYRDDALAKLTAAAEIAKAQNLIPVILGDLFHVAAENDLATLVRLIRVLKSFHVRPLCVGGNHDKATFALADNDALMLLSVAEVLDVIDGEAQEVLRIQSEKGITSLWVTPYGAPIPHSIDPNGADFVVMATHHDLAFQGAYPGAAKLREIPGCDAVVNGHMHKTTPSVSMGTTTWHNPGNIEPLSVDCIDHKPAAWEWTHAHGKADLTRHLLPHERDVWDLTGLTVKEAPSHEAVAAISVPAAAVEAGQFEQLSEFAQLMSAQTKMETAREDTSDSFVEDLTSSFQKNSVKPIIQELLIALAKKRAAPVSESLAEH